MKETHQKIKSITEAFSMQPNKWYVCDVKEDYVKPGETKPHIHKENCIVRIEKVWVEKGECIYVAYDFKDREIYEWQAKGVNVEYFYE